MLNPKDSCSQTLKVVWLECDRKWLFLRAQSFSQTYLKAEYKCSACKGGNKVCHQCMDLCDEEDTKMFLPGFLHVLPTISHSWMVHCWPQLTLGPKSTISIHFLGDFVQLFLSCWMGDSLNWRLTSFRVSRCHKTPLLLLFFFPWLWIGLVLFLLSKLSFYCMIWIDSWMKCARIHVFASSGNVETVERKGEREFALCPFQPSLCVVCLSLHLLLPVKFVFLSFHV